MKNCIISPLLDHVFMKNKFYWFFEVHLYMCGNVTLPFIIFHNFKFDSWKVVTFLSFAKYKDEKMDPCDVKTMKNEANVNEKWSQNIFYDTPTLYLVRPGFGPCPNLVRSSVRSIYWSSSGPSPNMDQTKPVWGSLQVQNGSSTWIGHWSELGSDMDRTLSEHGPNPKLVFFMFSVKRNYFSNIKFRSAIMVATLHVYHGGGWVDIVFSCFKHKHGGHLYFI